MNNAQRRHYEKRVRTFGFVVSRFSLGYMRCQVMRVRAQIRCAQTVITHVVTHDWRVRALTGPEVKQTLHGPVNQYAYSICTLHCAHNHYHISLMAQQTAPHIKRRISIGENRINAHRTSPAMHSRTSPPCPRYSVGCRAFLPGVVPRNQITHFKRSRRADSYALSYCWWHSCDFFCWLVGCISLPPPQPCALNGFVWFRVAPAVAADRRRMRRTVFRRFVSRRGTDAHSSADRAAKAGRRHQSLARFGAVRIETPSVRPSVTLSVAWARKHLQASFRRVSGVAFESQVQPGAAEPDAQTSWGARCERLDAWTWCSQTKKPCLTSMVTNLQTTTLQLTTFRLSVIA